MRLQSIDPEEATGSLKVLFEKLVMVPNVLCLMANSEPVIQSYANFHRTQSSYMLAEKYRKMISLAVSQYNDCSYCVALHTSTALDSGVLTAEECIDSRQMKSSVLKTNAILCFTKDVLESRGKINDTSVIEIRKFGITDQEIVEIIAVISMITLANITANIGNPELDFLEPPSID